MRVPPTAVQVCRAGQCTASRTYITTLALLYCTHTTCGFQIFLVPHAGLLSAAPPPRCLCFPAGALDLDEGFFPAAAAPGFVRVAFTAPADFLPDPPPAAAPAPTPAPTGDAAPPSTSPPTNGCASGLRLLVPGSTAGCGGRKMYGRGYCFRNIMFVRRALVRSHEDASCTVRNGTSTQASNHTSKQSHKQAITQPHKQHT